MQRQFVLQRVTGIPWCVVIMQCRLEKGHTQAVLVQAVLVLVVVVLISAGLKALLVVVLVLVVLVGTGAGAAGAPPPRHSSLPDQRRLYSTRLLYSCTCTRWHWQARAVSSLAAAAGRLCTRVHGLGRVAAVQCLAASCRRTGCSPGRAGGAGWRKRAMTVQQESTQT